MDLFSYCLKKNIDAEKYPVKESEIFVKCNMRISQKGLGAVVFVYMEENVDGRDHRKYVIEEGKAKTPRKSCRKKPKVIILIHRRIVKAPVIMTQIERNNRFDRQKAEVPPIIIVRICALYVQCTADAAKVTLIRRQGLQQMSLAQLDISHRTTHPKKIERYLLKHEYIKNN